MTYYGRKILTRVIIVVLLFTIIAAVVLFIVFKLNHKDNEPSSKIYFDYPQSENVVSDEESGEIQKTSVQDIPERACGIYDSLFSDFTGGCAG